MPTPEIPPLSPYALCDAEDVAELLGYTDQQMSNRQRTLIRVINASATAIRRRSQREFKQTEAELDQRRFFLITPADVTRGYVRVGDMTDWPVQARLWSPDRTEFVEFDVTEDTGDIWPLPDVPEPGMPFEYLKVKTTKSLVAGWWLSITSDWGFPAVPDDIIQVAVGTAAEWVLNDVMKLSELARQQGRPVRLGSLIPSQYDETIDGYRIYRVS